MRPLTVDDYTQRTNNQPMNLGAVGERVRVWRIEKRWTQAKLAEKAKVSLGTVQALEDAINRTHPRQTSPDKLQAIAKALGRSVDDLIRDRNVIEPTNPLLKGLNDEHLEEARWYALARKRTREVVDLLMEHGADDRVASLLLRILALPSETIPLIENFVASTAEVHPSPPAEEKKPKPADKHSLHRG